MFEHLIGIFRPVNGKREDTYEWLPHSLVILITRNSSLFIGKIVSNDGFQNEIYIFRIFPNTVLSPEHDLLPEMKSNKHLYRNSGLLIV